MRLNENKIHKYDFLVIDAGKITITALALVKKNSKF